MIPDLTLHRHGADEAMVPGVAPVTGEAETEAAPISLRDELLGPKHRPDPWAHRRGEPRTFAFFWTMFVLIAVAGSVMWVARYAALTSGAYAPAARIMLMVVGVGMTLLWPMVRLSQQSPPRPVIGHVLVDTWIVLVPVQMVLWPLVFLAGWPTNIVLGVAGNLLAWGALTGGVLALALAGPPLANPRDPRLRSRTGWMLLMVVLTLGAPILDQLLRLVRSPTVDPGTLAMLSPVTSVATLTGRGMLGPQNPISPAQWQTMLGVGLAGACVWVLAFVRDRIGNRRAEA